MARNVEHCERRISQTLFWHIWQKHYYKDDLDKDENDGLEKSITCHLWESEHDQSCLRLIWIRFHQSQSSEKGQNTNIAHWANDEDDDGRYGSLQNRWGRAGTCISSGWEVLATGRMKAILGNNDHHYYDDGDDDEDHPHHYHHH